MPIDTNPRLLVGRRARRRPAALLAGLLALAPCSAGAEERPDPATAEWAQTYDVDAQQGVSEDRTPVLSAGTRAATEQAVHRYRDIVAAGGWPTVPTGRALHVGSEGPDVSTLRRRLTATGDMEPGHEDGDVYDDIVAAAVRHFQARHGISRRARRRAKRWPPPP